MNATVSKIDGEAVLSSPNKVGPSKPLGYLPLQTVEEYLSLDVEGLARQLRNRGLKTKVIPGEECCIQSGGVYTYDERALQDALDKERGALEAHSWPAAADDFAGQVAKYRLDIGHPIFAAVRRAFADHVNSDNGDERGI